MEKKPARKRLKKLMRDVCHQLEFYFSDANLRKDRFLQKEMSRSDQGYVSLKTIASFNKMKNLTTDVKTIVAAIKQSSLLEVNEDQTMVRRKMPLGQPKYDPDDCMVYVECLPKKADHDWLKRVFSTCGNVVYVSLPRYKSTHDIKGFAFIEFESPQEAGRACELMNNPPADARARAGRFPIMRGRKRIVPVELVSSMKNNYKAKSHDQQEQSHDRERESHDQTLKSHDQRQRPETESSSENKPPKIKDKDSKDAVLSEKIEDFDKERQKRKRKLDEGSDPGGSSGLLLKVNTDEKSKKVKDSTKEKTCSSKQDEGKDPVVSKKSRKRRHTDRSGDDECNDSKKRGHSDTGGNDDGNDKDSNAKSSKTEASPLEADKCLISQERKLRQNRKEEKDEGVEEVEDKNKEGAKEETAEERRIKILEMGRKMMKRKRSLSEGDKWTVRFRDDVEDVEKKEEKMGERTKEDEEDGEGRTKRLRTDSTEGDEEAKQEDSIADLSNASSSERKRRNRKKKVLRKMQEEEDSLFLRVISKREWLELRQEYLDLQKSCLARMKQSYPHRDMPPKTRERNVPEPVVTVPSEVSETKKGAVCTEKGPEFVKGTVLRLTCMDSSITRKDIKDQLETITPVAYIDLPDGETQGHVRFHSSEGPEAVLSRDIGPINITLSRITDEEEEAYWQKLWLDRENKLKSKHTKKKKKGANKISQKAERVSTAKTKIHIHFDE